MSAYSTSSPSIEQTRWYLILPPSLACTCRNETSWDSVAAYSFTGTLTSPKDTAPFQIARISYLRDHKVGPVSGLIGANARAEGVVRRVVTVRGPPAGPRPAARCRIPARSPGRRA